MLPWPPPDSRYFRPLNCMPRHRTWTSSDRNDDMMMNRNLIKRFVLFWIKFLMRYGIHGLLLFEYLIPMNSNNFIWNWNSNSEKY